MSYVVVCLVALAASTLTFFSGFGLGTLLLPAFALVFPMPIAVSATAVVHLLNNLFKLTLVGSQAKARTVMLLGLPAVPAALVGAWLLGRLVRLPRLASYELFGRAHTITVIDVVIAALICVFALIELTRAGSRLAFPPRLLPLGGLVMGFFGGLSGHQGALRSAFLIRCGLSKEAYIGTGVVCAVLVDLTRVTVYGRTVLDLTAEGTNALPLVGAATAAAVGGAWIGSRLMTKVTLTTVRRLVGWLLILLALGLGFDLI